MKRDVFVCLSLLYLIYIYMTTRFTLSAKVKVIVKTEEAVRTVSHFLAFCAAKVGIFFHSAKRFPDYFVFRLKKGFKLPFQTSFHRALFLKMMCRTWAKEKHNVSCLVFSRVRKPNETCCDRFSHACENHPSMRNLSLCLFLFRENFIMCCLFPNFVAQ